jgi:hypothetical protein
MQGDSSTTDLLDSSLESASPSSTSLRLLLHLKDNQVQYLLGLLVLHQLGALEKVFAYGAGMC